MYFPTAGIETYPLWPFCVAFGVSLVCSTAGISGAFLLLPYQLSVLGYTAPGVSGTNQIFNILACPAGVWRFAKEKRLLLPLTIFIAIGTLPGVFAGAIIRIKLLASTHSFILFVAFMLALLSIRMLGNELRLRSSQQNKNSGSGICKIKNWSWQQFSFEYNSETYRVNSLAITGISLIIGLLGGIYGVGGGAIMAPVLIAFFNLPIHAIAGATLFATFITSISGVIFYYLLSVVFSLPAAEPDWILGLILGTGGILGMYCGASLQKFIPARYLRLILILIISLLSINYFIQFFHA